MRANLHLHSMFSDGTQWPEEIVARAKHAGYQAIALTDHDTMQGIPDFLRACKQQHLHGIPGVEIDCVAKDFDFDKEFLGFFPSGHCASTIEFTERIRKGRMIKIKKYLDAAREIVFKDHPRAGELTYDEIVRFKVGFLNDHALGLPFSWNKSNFYKFLLKKEIVEKNRFDTGNGAEGDAYKPFKKWFFTPEHLGDPEIETKPTIGDVVATILSDRGFPVIPHIGHLHEDKIAVLRRNEDALLRFLKYCQDIGVWGVELYYYDDISTSTLINSYLVKLCQDNGLTFKFTYVSDCHGRGHETCNLESYSGNFSGFY
jgi:hypothetical protein